MFAGGKVGVAFELGALVAVVLVANLLLAGYAAILGVAAFRSGLPTTVMARYCFGEWGSRWSDFLLGFTQIGWYAWGTGTVAAVFVRLAGLSSSWQLPLMFFFGLFFCITAYIGYRGLDLLARVTVPLMAALIFWSLARAAASYTPSLPTESLGWGQALTIIVGTFVSGATQSTNWTRFASSQRGAVGATLAAFLLGNGLMVFYGAFAAIVYQQPDVVEVLALQGVVVGAAIMLFGNIWTTQDNTIYNFSVAGCSLLRTDNRRLVTLAGALIGTLLATFGFADALVPFLLLLGTWIPPLGGVIMADFYWVRGGAYPPLSEPLPALHWPGVVAYAAGVAAALWVPGVAPINGVVVAFLVYRLASR